MKSVALFSTLMLVGVIGTTASTTAQDASEKKLAQLVRISEAAGLEEIITGKFIEGMLENGDITEVGFPEETIRKFGDILIERFEMNDFLKQTFLPVLDPHFTTPELTQIADVLESDIGQNFLEAQLSGEEFDMMAMMEDENVDRAALSQAMATFITLAPKFEALSEGEIGASLEESVRTYTQNFLVRVVSDIIDEAAG